MSERGVFAVDRGIWDHPVFADEPLTEREAWQWLIGEASFKARTRNVAGRQIPLRRGQLAASVRFMADRWGWGKSSVDRFLKKLKNETMIGTDAGTGLLVITICNYDKFQRVSLPSGTAADAPSGTVAGQSRDKTEDTEDTEGSTELRSAPPLASAPVYTDSRHELWGEGIPILTALGVKDRDARGNIGRWLKTMNDDAQAVLGAIQRARDNRILDPIPWITQALKGNGNGSASGFNRNSGASGGQQSGSDAILAGVVAATERRARQRDQGKLPENPAAPRQPDLEFGGTRNR